MSQLLNLNNQQRKQFSKHFLMGVYLNLTLTKSLTSEVLSNTEALKTKLNDMGYDRCEEIIHSQFSVRTNKAETVLDSTSGSKVLGLKFISSSSKLEISFQDDMIAIASTKYSGMDNFLEQLNELISQISPIIKIEAADKIMKVGLRKINSIIINPVEALPIALNAFNPALFSLARSKLFNIDSFKSTEEGCVIEHNNSTCIIKTSLQKHRSKALVAYLDFDLISQAVDTLENVLFHKIKELNQTHYDLFIWSVTKDLLSVME